MKNNFFHNFTVSLEELYQELKSGPDGISEGEAAKRLAEYGYNTIATKKELNAFFEFLSHFKSPLVLVLLATVAVSGYLGEIKNAAIIGFLVVFSVVLDYIEEHSAGRAAEKLKEKVRTTATVIRKGKTEEIMIGDVCPGDLIFLSSGDMVPADARIIKADDFFVNQSAITGESFPSEKTTGALKNEPAGLSEMSNAVFFGSSVVSGTAKAIVVRTGKNTEFGKIAATLSKNGEKSDFELGVARFGFFIMRIIIFLVLVIFLLNSLINKNVLQSFIFAIAIAVGVTPELLPMIMSITMARGSIRMSKKGVIVKKLSAIPSFGSMNILCTDKTGTLTEDKITIVKYTNVHDVDDENVLLYAYLNSHYQTGVKNPLDKAVIDFRKIDIQKYEKYEEIPFDFYRKMMSVAVKGPEGRTLITKGAPEEVLKRCKFYQDGKAAKELTPDVSAQATRSYNTFSEQGHRVLALAVKPNIEYKVQYSKNDESGLTFLGFISFLDPAKKDIKKVLRDMEEMGVEIKILTGDNELVAKKICDDVGLDIRGIMLGSDLEKLSDEALKVRAKETTLFARFSPDQKNRVISALRSNQNVVGYVGDGINDAPSLKNADVGISVHSGVDVAKESADIVLTHKSLESLIGGIEEGRKAFGNTMKYIMIGLSSNFGNMFSILGAIFFVPFLPMLPVQILLNNLIYDFSQVPIPTDNVDRSWIIKPRRWNMQFIKEFMYVFGPISSLYDIITYALLLFVFRLGEHAFQTGWFLESLATQTLVIHIIRTKHLPFVQSVASKPLLASTFSAVVIGWIIPYTFIGRFFNFEPLPPSILLVIAGLVLAYLLMVQAAKAVFYKKYNY